MTLMKQRLRGLALALGLMVVALPAQAGFLYTFSFGSLTNQGRDYSAASFSFETPSILGTLGQVAAVSPSGDLNGFAVTQVVVDQLLASEIGFASYVGVPNASGVQQGDVAAFYFLLGSSTASVPGTYGSFLAGRGLAIGGGSSGTVFVYTSGTLTIQDVGPPGVVPAPPAMGLVVVGLLGLLAARPRRAG
jgi:hypothetical protein